MASFLQGFGSSCFLSPLAYLQRPSFFIHCKNPDVLRHGCLEWPGSLAGILQVNIKCEQSNSAEATLLSFVDNPPSLVSPSQVSVALFPLYPGSFLLPSLNSSLHHCLLSSLFQGKKDTASLGPPVRLLGPQAGKVLEFPGILASLAPRIPFPSPLQTTGRSKKPSRHRPG